jgi:ATP-binding cassette subfamily F protein uup
LSYLDNRELTELPARIAALEREQAEIASLLGDAAMYRKQPDRLKSFQQRFAEIEQELMQALERWENLVAKQ